MTSHTRYLDHIVGENSPHAPYVEEARLVGTYDIGLAKVNDNPGGHYPDPPVNDIAIQLMTKGNSKAQIDLGCGAFNGRLQKGSFVVSPANTATDYCIDDAFSLYLVSIPYEMFEKTQELIGDSNEFNLDSLYTQAHRDPLVEHLVHRMVDEAGSCSLGNELFVDHAAHILVANIFSMAGRIRKKKRETKALSDAHLDRVRRLIDEKLADKLTLSELADAVDYDVFQFTRAFSIAVGQTPYQYLLGSRMARARDLLAQTSIGLGAVAKRCGFSSQSHFTSAFSKHVGVPPGVYRNEMQS